jgi:hypothetical protein
MKWQLFSLSVFLTVSLSAAVNDAFHARNDVSSALKPSNAYSRLPEHESVFYGKVDQVERSLGIHVTIHIYNTCDCPDGPKCPHHFYECPNGKFCGEEYKCDGNIFSQNHDVDDGDESEEVHLVPCNEVDGSKDLSMTEVKWFFFVETNTQDPSNVVEKVCGVMGNAVLDAAFGDECSIESNRRRRLEIKGHSENVTCTHYEDCMPTDENSESCGVYEATVVVAFDDEGEDNTSASEVSSTVTGAAEDSFANDDIKKTVNEELDDTGEAATVVGYGNPNNGNEEATSGINGEIQTESKSGLSRAGKAAIAAMAALILLLLLLCFICWRRRRNHSDEDKSVGSGNTELSPSRRLFGSGSRGASRSGGSQTDDDMTYMTSDFNNLGMHHSKLDVHVCASASCDQCNPIVRQQTAGVYFVGTQGGSPLSDILEEEYKSSSEYKSEQSSPEEDDIGNDAIPPPPPSHPPPNEDNGATEKKSFFSRFRRSKAPPATETPVVHSPGGREAGNDQIEIEI